MSALFAEINGQHVSLNDCDWVWWAPCGCPWGVTVARYSPTEADAWRMFYPRKRDAERAERRGERMELLTHQRYRDEVCDRMRQRCTHEAGATATRKPKTLKRTPKPEDQLIASYTSWRDMPEPECPCIKHGPFPDQYPHVWQIRTRSIHCRVDHEAAA